MGSHPGQVDPIPARLEDPIPAQEQELLAKFLWGMGFGPPSLAPPFP